MIAAALGSQSTPEAVRVDVLPARQVAAALRRTPDEVRLAVLSTHNSRSDRLRRDLSRALAEGEAFASTVNAKLVTAARAASFTEDDFSDFYTELVVANGAVDRLKLFSEIPLLRITDEFRQFDGLEYATDSISEVDGKPASTRSDLAAARAHRALELRYAGATLAEIGVELGVTRERARQILAKVDAPSAGEVRATKSAARDAALQAVRDEYAAFLQGRPPMTLSEAAEALGVDRSRLVETMDDTLRRMVLPDPKANNAHWSRQEVVKVLVEAATLEYPLTAKGYAQLLKDRLVQGPSVPRIGQIFGTWLAACEAAGVEAGVRPRADYSSKWTDDDLVDAVRRYLDEANHRTYSGYSEWAGKQDDRPSGPTVRNRLGRWNDILRLVHKASYSEEAQHDD